jgi:hypothetical protein|tara:strand:+ start:153 stop:590 length:438 start_codon:yes stop_codon:yes gene_type:complete
MLKSIQSNNSPGHSHNRLPSVVDLSVDSCPGIILKRNNKMRNIGDTFHFKGYVWEIVDRFRGGYALGRVSKDRKIRYSFNGWVTENYTVFDINPNKSEIIKENNLHTCKHCGDTWENTHYCSVRNTSEKIKARQQKSIARYGRLA